jgi:hypothetical protein
VIPPANTAASSNPIQLFAVLKLLWVRAPRKKVNRLFNAAAIVRPRGIQYRGLFSNFIRPRK